MARNIPQPKTMTDFLKELLMRLLSIFMLVVFCGTASADEGKFVLPPVGGTIADCSDGVCPLLPAPSIRRTIWTPRLRAQCQVPMKLVPSCPLREPTPTLAPRKPVRKIVKRAIRPFKTIRESRAVRGRWVDRPGRRGPRRFLQRLRGWRPLRGRCCR